MTGSRDPRAVRVFCVVIFGAAVGTGLGLLIAGAPRPGIAPVLLLAVAVALCVNRYALFPTEQAATAEAAVLLAAVVGFHADAVFLGPLAVGLLVGPLDALHWEQRSFLRMVHNAGNRGLSALAAAGAFVGVEALVGRSPLGLALAIVAAAGALASVDTMLSVILLRLQGTPRREAIHHVLEIDALTLPVACYGAAVGFLAGVFGWWATALALVPAAFIPELVLARARWSGAVVRDVACGLVVAGVLVAMAVVTPVPDPAMLVVLVAIGVLAGAELAVARRSAMPPLLAVVVVAAVVLADGDGAFFAAALVAATGTFTAWWGAGLRPRVRVFAGVAVAIGSGLTAATVFAAAPASLPGAAALAVAAGVVFELAAIATAGARRQQVARMLWTVPLVVVAVASSFAWQTVGLGGGALFAVGTAAAFAAAAWWGSPPWRSRILAPRMQRVTAAHHRAALGITCAAAGVAAIAATRADSHLGLVLLWAALALAESAVAMVLLGVRQWRFAPRPRARALAIGLAASLVLALGYPALAADRSPWGVALIVAVLVLMLFVGRAAGARADDTSRSRHATPMP